MSTPDLPLKIVATTLAPTANSRSRYLPAVGPRMRVLLFWLFAAFAALGATGAYLAAITILNLADSSKLYTTAFTFWMLLAHCAVGLIGIGLFLTFGLIHLVTAWRRPNRVAVRLGLLVLALGLFVCASGLGLFRLGGLPSVGRRAQLPEALPT